MVILVGAAMTVPAMASAPKDCSHLFSDLHPDEPTARFIRLLHSLSVEKNLLQLVHLEALINSNQPINPLTGEQTSTQNFVYGTSFEDILKEGGIKWERVREASRAIAKQKADGEKRTHDADEKAKPILYPFVLYSLEHRAIGPFWYWKDAPGNIHLAAYSRFRLSSGGHWGWVKVNSGDYDAVSLQGSSDAKIFAQPNGTVFSLYRGNSIYLHNNQNGEDQELPSKRNSTFAEPIRKPNGDQAVIFGQRQRSQVFLGDFQNNTVTKLPKFRTSGTNFIHGDNGTRLLAVVRKNNSIHLIDVWTGNRLAKSEIQFSSAFETSKGELFLQSPTGVLDLRHERTIATNGNVGFFENRKGETFLSHADRQHITLVELDSGRETKLDLPSDFFPIGREKTPVLTELSDGRKVAFLSDSFRLLLCDFSNGTVEDIYDVPGRLIEVSQTADGPLIGIFKDGEKVRFVQLYGPPPGGDSK